MEARSWNNNKPNRLSGIPYANEAGSPFVSRPFCTHPNPEPSRPHHPRRDAVFSSVISLSTGGGFVRQLCLFVPRAENDANPHLVGG